MEEFIILGKGAYEEVAEAKQRGLHIDLLTVDKLLEYEEPAGQGKSVLKNLKAIFI